MGLVPIPIIRKDYGARIGEIISTAYKNRAIIAGGFARYHCSPTVSSLDDRSLAGTDIDIFTTDYLGIEQMKLALTRKHLSFTGSAQLYNQPVTVYSYKMAGVSSLDDWPKVQLIATEEAPEEILSKFDFTVCQVCLVDNKGFASPEFFNDETNRRIRLNFVWPLIGADLLFCRVYKYVIKGYTLDLSTAMTLYNRMINATPEENNTWGGDPVSAEMINSWFTGLNSTTPGAGMSPEDWKKFSTLTGLIAAADKM